MKRCLLTVLLLVLAASVVQAGALDALKGLDVSKVKSAAKVGKAMRKGFSDLTEQEEYYIGRTVAAMILAGLLVSLLLVTNLVNGPETRYRKPVATVNTEAPFR